MVCRIHHNYSLSRQKGITLILFVFMLGLAITALSMKLFSSSNMLAQRQTKSTQALDKAKSAVIANVVTGLSGSSIGQFPCDEDTTLIGLNTEGQAKGTCNGSPVLGRFAWRSLNTGDLRDGNADKLWYALSAGYRSTPVNSDTVPALTVNGTANKAIAILFSPGTILQNQSRSVPTASSPPAVSQYLDLENNNGDNVFTLASPSSTFNDQGLTIEPDDIYPLLEKRVLKEFKGFLNDYKATWGAFPYPATFSNPTSASYLGVLGNSGGFLPVTNGGNSTTWNTTTVPVPTINAPLGNIVSPVCSFRSGNTRIRCDVTIALYNSANPPTISFTGIVDNIGKGFYDGLVVTNTNDIQITTRTLTATVTTASRSISHSLDSAGRGLVTFSGTLANTGIVRIEYRRVPQHSNWVLAATNHYLLANNWHQLVNYQVAEPYLPGGSQTCNGNCLTINRIDVTPSTQVTNVHALLIAAGRKLVTTNYRPAPTYNSGNPAQSRAGASLEDYYDSANNVLPVHNVSMGLDFDSAIHPMSTFNDQIEMVE